MELEFERLDWEDLPSTNTPISAENLNRIEEGVAGLYSERYEMQSNIAYVEDGDTSANDYIPGQYLMRHGVFYKVTKVIYYGDEFDFTEDGNITHVDIASQFGSGSGGSTGCVELTQAEYDALPESLKMADVIYLITDSPDNYMDEVFGDFATVEVTNTASKAYVIGDYLVYNNKFYKVTAAIAKGGTITPGTNVTQTTVGAEISRNATKSLEILDKSYTFDYSIGANASLSISSSDLGISTPDGYMIGSITSFATGNGNIVPRNISTNPAIRNLASTQQTGTLNIAIRYLKKSL